MPQTSHRVPTKIRCPRCATLNPAARSSCRECGAGLARPVRTGRRASILTGALAKPLARNFTRPLAAAGAPIADKLKQPLKRMKETSSDMFRLDLEMAEDLWQGLVRQLGRFAPNLPQAIQRLAQLESYLAEVTGLEAPAIGLQGGSISEELRWLRERLHQAAGDAEAMLRIRHARDLDQVLDSLTAAMRLSIAAVGIARLTLDMANSLNPRRMVREGLSRDPR